MAVFDKTEPLISFEQVSRILRPEDVCRTGLRGAQEFKEVWRGPAAVKNVFVSIGVSNLQVPQLGSSAQDIRLGNTL